MWLMSPRAPIGGLKLAKLPLTKLLLCLNVMVCLITFKVFAYSFPNVFQTFVWEAVPNRQSTYITNDIFKNVFEEVH